MGIDYENITPEQVEENIEFIDWVIIPDHLITNEIKDKFSSFPALKARMWFKEILNSLEIKIDEKEYPNNIYFFSGEKCIVDYNIKNGDFWISDQYIWSVFRINFGFNFAETQRIITIMVEQHLENNAFVSISCILNSFTKVEQHFKNKVVMPIFNAFIEGSFKEQYFKNVVIMPADSFEMFFSIIEEHFKYNVINFYSNGNRLR